MPKATKVERDVVRAAYTAGRVNGIEAALMIVRHVMGNVPDDSPGALAVLRLERERATAEMHAMLALASLPE